MTFIGKTIVDEFVKDDIILFRFSDNSVIVLQAENEYGVDNIKIKENLSELEKYQLGVDALKKYNDFMVKELGL